MTKLTSVFAALTVAIAAASLLSLATPDAHAIMGESRDPRTIELAAIAQEAAAYFPGGSFTTGFDSIAPAIRYPGNRNLTDEAAGENLLDRIYGDFSAQLGSTNTAYSYIFYATYNTGTTTTLGSGERVGVLNSWRSAYGRNSLGNANDWSDMLKIANGRWPSARSTTAESAAKSRFEKIYLRAPNDDNANDQAAVTIMAYGLRPEPRNVAKEQDAIGLFKLIFDRDPVSASDWDSVRAIAYSGASR